MNNSAHRAKRIEDRKLRIAVVSAVERHVCVSVFVSRRADFSDPIAVGFAGIHELLAQSIDVLHLELIELSFHDPSDMRA